MKGIVVFLALLLCSTVLCIEINASEMDANIWNYNDEKDRHQKPFQKIGVDSNLNYSINDDFTLYDFIPRLLEQECFRQPIELGSLVCADEDSVELIIGLKVDQDFCYLNELALIDGCEFKEEISVGEGLISIIIDVPFTSVPILINRIHNMSILRYIEPNLRHETFITPNDQSWIRQWGPHKIKAETGWNKQIGDSSIMVAVVDTGIDWDHPDLSRNYLPLGYDWVNNDNDPMDDDGHGTHCAGIIAATQCNGIGVSGLAQVSLIAEKGLDSGGRGYSDDLAEAIIHAVDQGAHIISMSWGSPIASYIIYDAVKYAYDSGRLLIAAAGNDATDYKFYPAGFEAVIAVSATGQNDQPASFTNFGDWVELAAPGVGIYSTVLSDTYDYKSGTSMACPHVAGLASLVWSQFPGMTRDQVRLKLRITSDDLGAEGYDQYYGYGRINADLALEKSLPEHDLLIENWETSQYQALGSTLLVNGTILNYGTTNEIDISILLLANDTIVDTAVINYLESGYSKKTTLSWDLQTEGFFNVTIGILPLVDEDVIVNNFFSSFVSVGIPQVIQVPDQFETISEAVNAASPLDIIKLRSGIYYEKHISIRDPIKIQGDNYQTTIICGNGTGGIFSIDTVDNVAICDLSIENATMGITIINSMGLSLRNVTLNNVDYDLLLYGSILADYVHDIDTTNTVNNKPIYYLLNRKNEVLPEEVGYVAVVNSTGIQINGLNMNQSLLIAYSNSSTIKNSVISAGFFDGIRLFWSCNNTLENNTVYESFSGIGLIYSGNNRIFGNEVASNYYGIVLSISTGNAVDSNMAFDNENHDIYFSCSGQNLLKNNILNSYNISFDIWGTQLSHYIQEIDNSNIIINKVLYYIINQNGTIIDPVKFPNAGYLAIANSTNVTIKDFQLRENNIDGVLLAFLKNSTVKNLYASQNENGITLYKSDYNKIERNDFSRNWLGIKLHNSDYNIVENNIINSNGQGGIHVFLSHENIVTNNTMLYTGLLALGIEKSNGNTVVMNTFSFSPNGIALLISSSNKIIGNNITDDGYGLTPLFSDNNIIYHNNFINNTKGHIWYFLPSFNIWDGGYPLGGNFWCDHESIDVNLGPDQDKNGSDGIIDIPYVIDNNNTDQYPLLNPWILKIPKGPGDLDGDGEVSIFDLCQAIASYNSKPGWFNWNPYADLAPPYEKIDIYDIVTIAYLYGETYT